MLKQLQESFLLRGTTNKMKRAICLGLTILILCSSFLPTFAYDGGTVLKQYNNDPIENADYKSYAIINCISDTVLEEKNADNKQPIGNLVKMMTLLLVFDAIHSEKLSMTQELKAPEGIKQYGQGNSAFMTAGEKQTVENLIKAVCVNSANDAALTLALSLAKSEGQFVKMMNDKAKELGMTNTHFADCTGLERSNAQCSTARDMARLAYKLVTDYPKVTEYTAEKRMEFWHSGSKKNKLYTNNTFIHYYSKATGLCATKGETTGFCLAGSATVGEENFVVVVLGAADDNNALVVGKKLIEICAKKYDYVTIDVKGTYIRQIAVKNGKEKTVKAETGDNFEAFVKVEDKDKVEKTVVPNEVNEAPIKEGDVLGKIVYSANGIELGTVDIVAAEEMKKANIFVRFFRWFLSLFGLE